MKIIFFALATGIFIFNGNDTLAGEPQTEQLITSFNHYDPISGEVSNESYRVINIQYSRDREGDLEIEVIPKDSKNKNQAIKTFLTFECQNQYNARQVKLLLEGTTKHELFVNKVSTASYSLHSSSSSFRRIEIKTTNTENGKSFQIPLEKYFYQIERDKNNIEEVKNRVDEINTGKYEDSLRGDIQKTADWLYGVGIFDKRKADFDSPNPKPADNKAKPEATENTSDNNQKASTDQPDATSGSAK